MARRSRICASQRESLQKVERCLAHRMNSHRDDAQQCPRSPPSTTRQSASCTAPVERINPSRPRRDHNPAQGRTPDPRRLGGTSRACSPGGQSRPVLGCFLIGIDAQSVKQGFLPSSPWALCFVGCSIGLAACRTTRRVPSTRLSTILERTLVRQARAGEVAFALIARHATRVIDNVAGRLAVLMQQV